MTFIEIDYHGLQASLHPRLLDRAEPAVFNALNYSMFDLVHGYAREGMSAGIKRQEKVFASESRGYNVTKHQREVGAGYFDDIATALNPNAFTLALVGSTEEGQFH